MSELEQWWNEKHPETTGEDCPFDVYKLRSLRAAALEALKRDQRYRIEYDRFLFEMTS
jgi:hypothetical protein